MLRLVFVSLLICLTIILNAQKRMFEKNIILENSGKENRESLMVTDSMGSTSLFLIDELTVHGIHISDDSVVHELEAPRPEKKYNDILGCQLKGSEYTVFFSNSWHTDLASVTFNFITKEVKHFLIPLNLDNESYVSAFVSKNKLYFITRLKGGVTGIRLFTFLEDGKFATNTYNFKSIDTGLTTFYSALGPNETAYIDSDILDEIDVAYHQCKIFCSASKIYMNLDHSDKSTAVVSIDLKTYESTLKVYKQGIQGCGEINTTNNSFIYNDKLFQFTSCSSGINLRIRDLADGNILKEYSATKNEDIIFKNSPFVRRMLTSFDDDKELNAKQFFRKASNGLAFVSVYQLKNSLIVNLGSYRFYSGAVPMGPSGAMAGGHSSEALIYFESLFSVDTFEHIGGKVPNTPLDKINKYLDKFDDAVAETICKYNGKYYVGYYRHTSKQYVLMEFEG